jgi:alkanesulfonate monooxygenase SsuD/methylene tetrahydromethanopterin reductase-like flavin-dependent oxidoreductase (luciferase family)
MRVVMGEQATAFQRGIFVTWPARSHGEQPMKLGIYLDLRNPRARGQTWRRTYEFGLELCQVAESRGLSSVWLTEHHRFADGYLPQPLTFAAAVAVRTTQIRIGTAVLIAPIRPAALIAEEAAIVDILSGGRPELGLGGGHRIPEFELYGADPARRFGITGERVREIRRLWEEGVVSPVPIQQKVPIWLGYNGPQGARRAGRLGEGLLSADASLAGPYLEGLAEGGHDPAAARMSGLVSVFASRDPERSWQLVAPYHEYQWESYRQASVEGRPDLAKPRPFDPDRSRVDRLSFRLGDILFDTPEAVAGAIVDRTEGCPVETVFVWVSPGALPEDLALEHLETLASDVAPLLSRKGPTGVGAR